METHPLTVDDILAENTRRHDLLHQGFNPVTGQDAPGLRQQVAIRGWYHESETLFLPKEMLSEPAVLRAVESGSLSDSQRDELEQLRLRHDFAYWAYRLAYIKPKGGGDDVPLLLTFAQRRLVHVLEEMRQTLTPIRLVLLKARQWGGSTVCQLYMAWLQLTHAKGLNSLIIAHQGSATDEILSMYQRMLGRYPSSLLQEDDAGSKGQKGVKMRSLGHYRSAFAVPGRNCKVKIGTAERPDSCRGGDYNLVHLSEVGMWRATQGKKPEDIVRAACGGILYRPLTMIVYESTANGVGNFFHHEYIAARDRRDSQFRALFVPWFHIEANELPVDDERAFARQLLDNRYKDSAPTDRDEPGGYLWWLWESGATLQGIKWYIVERTKHSSHGSMAAECPTDDTEAFVNSGSPVFDKYHVEALREGCRLPDRVGELEGNAPSGEAALEGLRFVPDAQGGLSVWNAPDSEARDLRGAYLAVVDIGGRSLKSDWSVVAVFDRRPMMHGGNPQVVAQWYGHIDMDLLAWKAAQIAQWYHQALLVIESNTLETHSEQYPFILNQIRDAYPNLYVRHLREDQVKAGMARRYGFHTNRSTKQMVISGLIRVLREGLYVERDVRCLSELESYERKANGSMGAVDGCHDDLVMTRAIGLHICFDEMETPAPYQKLPPRPAASDCVF